MNGLPNYVINKSLGNKHCVGSIKIQAELALRFEIVRGKYYISAKFMSALLDWHSNLLKSDETVVLLAKRW